MGGISPIFTGIFVQLDRGLRYFVDLGLNFVRNTSILGVELGGRMIPLHGLVSPLQYPLRAYFFASITIPYFQLLQLLRQSLIGILQHPPLIFVVAMTTASPSSLLTRHKLVGGSHHQVGLGGAAGHSLGGEFVHEQLVVQVDLLEALLHPVWHLLVVLGHHLEELSSQTRTEAEVHPALALGHRLDLLAGLRPTQLSPLLVKELQVSLDLQLLFLLFFGNSRPLVIVLSLLAFLELEYLVLVSLGHGLLDSFPDGQLLEVSKLPHHILLLLLGLVFGLADIKAVEADFFPPLIGVWGT